MSTSSSVCVRSPRYSVPLASLCLVAFAATDVRASVVEQNYPSSSLTVELAPSSPVWTGWTLFGTGYGGGNNWSGGSGNIGHAYTGFGELTDIIVTLPELRNSYQGFTNTPSVRNFGQVLFTPSVNTPYAISGVIPLTFTGTNASSTLARAVLVLEEVSGPAIATYGNVMARAGGGTVVNNLFDNTTLIAGSGAGTLTGGVTYRLSWDFLVASELNGDTTFSADVSANATSFFAISFVPSPGTAGLVALGGLLAARRRR